MIDKTHMHANRGKTATTKKKKALPSCINLLI